MKQSETMGKSKREGKEKKRAKLRPGIEKNLDKLHQKVKNDTAKGGGKKSDLSDSRKSKFARALASTDWHTRERALRSLELWLASSSEVSPKDLRKVWKGLYFCFWHSDKTPVQQELAERLSKLVSNLKTDSVALAFWQTFLDTMAREWSSIDRLRLDKFMSLVRMFVHSCLDRMSSLDWHPEVVVPMWELLGRTLLKGNEAGDGVATTGLVLHLSHIFIDELEQVCAKSTGRENDDAHEQGNGGEASPSSPPSGAAMELPDTIPSDVLSFLVEPFRLLLCTTTSKAIMDRVAESVYSKLCRKCTHCLQEIESGASDADTVRPGYPFVQIDAVDMAKDLFEVAADPATRQINREKVYDVVAVVERLAEYQNQVMSTDLAALPEANGAAEAAAAAVVAAEDEGKTKKRKKGKKEGLKKKGVVFKLNNNQVFKFHKKKQANVTYSPSRHVPVKGALKK